MNLTQLHHEVKRYHKWPKRVGRGDGSGHGGTSTRGGKGQSARTGYHLKRYFEGGQMPLIRKTPKRGFSNTRFADTVIVINLQDLNKFENGDTVNAAKLTALGFIKGEYDQIKILGKGELKKEGLTVEAHSFSATAAKIIAEKKGKAVWLNPPRPPKPVKAPPPKIEKPAAPEGKPGKAPKGDKPKGEKPPKADKPPKTDNPKPEGDKQPKADKPPKTEGDRPPKTDKPKTEKPKVEKPKPEAENKAAEPKKAPEAKASEPPAPPASGPDATGQTAK